jgi:hypothetical protein
MRLERWMVAAAAPSMISSVDIAGGVGRHVEHDTTSKMDFKSFSAIGTKLSHLADFRDWLVEERLSLSGRVAATSISGENRQRVRFARLASNATSRFSAIYVKVASNVDRGSIRRDEVGFERRPARVLGPFRVQMSDRVAEGGLKTPEKSAERGGRVERMTVSRSYFSVELTAKRQFEYCARHPSRVQPALLIKSKARVSHQDHYV